MFTAPDRRCSIELSKYGILQNGPDIKFWCASLPGVGQVRPRSCAGCDATGIEGDRVRIQGHGVVTRWVRGLLNEGSNAEDRELQLRRYRCQDCGAVMRVGPRGLVSRRQYTAPTILFALALWCIASQPTEAVRRVVSPDTILGATAAGERWSTLLRWAQTLTRRADSSGATLRDRTASALRSVANVLEPLNTS